jgi:catechol 2,3-dioxygenase-like lactoylglutathione lyase family enzyme
MAHLFRVIVPVGSIEAAARFYGAVLGGLGHRVSPGRHYFDCDGTILACYDPRADGDGRDATPLPEPLYIAVEDLDATYQRAKAAGARLSDAVVPDVGPLGRIATRPWGERSFYAADPFGNPLCFVSSDTTFTGPRA